MKPHPGMSIFFTGQDGFLEHKADGVWETICDNFLLDRPFTLKDVALVLEREYGWARSTAYQYAKVTLMRVTLEPDPCVARVSRKYWKLPQ